MRSTPWPECAPTSRPRQTRLLVPGTQCAARSNGDQATPEWQKIEQRIACLEQEGGCRGRDVGAHSGQGVDLIPSACSSSALRIFVRARCNRDEPSAARCPARWRSRRVSGPPRRAAATRRVHRTTTGRGRRLTRGSSQPRSLRARDHVGVTLDQDRVDAGSGQRPVLP